MTIEEEIKKDIILILFTHPDGISENGIRRILEDKEELNKHRILAERKRNSIQEK